MNKIITGDTAVFTFSIFYEGAVADVQAPDLSDCDVVFALKKLDSKTITKKTVHAPDSHIVSFTIPASETENFSQGTYFACCKLYYTSGVETTVWTGNITVIKGVLGAENNS